MKRAQFLTIKDPNNPITEWQIEVAKRIACAVVSYRVGVPYEELWEQYAHQREDVGTYWLAVAQNIGKDFPIDQ
jgi:hypothetical protein